MKLLSINFETMVGEAVGVAVLNGIDPKEIAVELRRMADVTEQRASELQQTIANAAQGQPLPTSPAPSPALEADDV